MMPSPSVSTRMIAAADGAAVAGSFEITFEPRRRPLPDPDPGETVRLPVFERPIRLQPLAHA
jgi:hypothetical protein